MKLSLTATLSFAFALAVSAPAEAATITFTLDCLITGAQACTPTTSKGTVTLTDNTTNSNWVDVSVNVDSGKIKDVHLNVNGTPPAGYTFTSTNGAVTYTANGEQADGYNLGLFDLDFAGNNDDPFTTTLKLGMGATFLDLNVSHFVARSDDGVFWAAINNNSGAGWVGATSLCATCPEITPTDLPPGALTPVPEPASLVLLGSGLLGGAWRMRKRRSAV